jgi:glutaryl-CoA dehydrogenase
MICPYSPGRPRLNDVSFADFIVERGIKGFAAPKIESKLSLRASTIGEVVLENAFVPEDNLLPNVKGLAGPFGCLNRARYGITLGLHGCGRAWRHANAGHASLDQMKVMSAIERCRALPARPADRRPRPRREDPRLVGRDSR